MQSSSSKQLILASGSASRKEILKRAHVKFIVDKSDYEEDMTLDLKPAQLAEFLSLGKAKTVAARHKNAVVLAADSFGVFNGHILGKPHTIDSAEKMLSMLSGNCHVFITGFSIIDCDSGKTLSGHDETKVYFRRLTKQQIVNYMSKENILNNAGAYRIQDLGSVLIDKIDGSYANVFGLPITKVAIALSDFGINIL